MAFKARDGALNGLNGMGGRFKVSLARAADQGGEMLVRKSQTGQRDGTKTGRMYGNHLASAPGEYSAPRTYAVHNSTDYKASASSLEFGIGAPHGVYLEAGTSRMEPRPNLKNAVDETDEQLKELFGQYILRRLLGGR